MYNGKAIRSLTNAGVIVDRVRKLAVVKIGSLGIKLLGKLDYLKSQGYNVIYKNE